jgi:hypothetical protein
VADKFDSGVHLVQEKMLAGRLDSRVKDVQVLGRLLSTQMNVKLAGAALILPEGSASFWALSRRKLVVGAAL